MLQIILGRTLKAVIVLRGLIIEWVNVKGFGEDMMTENGKVKITTKNQCDIIHKNELCLYFWIHTPFCR